MKQKRAKCEEAKKWHSDFAANIANEHIDFATFSSHSAAAHGGTRARAHVCHFLFCRFFANKLTQNACKINTPITWDAWGKLAKCKRRSSLNGNSNEANDLKIHLFESHLFSALCIAVVHTECVCVHCTATISETCEPECASAPQSSRTATMNIVSRHHQAY